MSPSPALRVCNHPRCPKLVRPGGPGRGRCPEHALAHSRAYTAIRGTAAERGYDSRWSAYSRHLRRTELITCGSRLDNLPPTGDSECLRDGRVTPAELVDHITPVTSPDDPRWFDRAGLQGLCHRCHNRKRQREGQAARG
jgi:5-methylcytosine-specific restriction protein A